METLFHELGHVLQHVLTTVDEGMVAGISQVEWDAVELPSQFMENWCYHVPMLKRLANHYLTGESLPQDLIDQLLASRTFALGQANQRQLQFGTLDLMLHASSGDEEPDPHALEQALSQRFGVLPPLEESRFLNGFSHIFAGGYAAGYYSYKWAEVLSSDAHLAPLKKPD